MSTLEDLERKEQSLLDQLKACRESLEVARQDALGLHVGDVVLFKGKPHKISSFEMWPKASSKLQFYDKPRASGYPQKKDGTWAANTRNMYRDWGRV